MSSNTAQTNQKPTPAASTRLQARDLITIGIYTAIYLVVACIPAALGIIPIFIPLLSVLCPLFGGIPLMLYISKIKHFGMLTISGLIMGLMMFVGGMGVWAPPLGLLGGVLADLALRAGKWQSSKYSVVAAGVFQLWIFGNFMPFYVGRGTYLAELKERFGADYAKSIEAFMPVWQAPILLVVCVVCGVIGGLLGLRVCRRYFLRAGII